MSTTWKQWLGDQKVLHLFGFPEEIEQRDWAPNSDDKRAAWLFYVELRTRICTQPLHHLDGDEKAALESIYMLFEPTRALLKDQSLSNATHFSELAFQFLNRIVRPFTAKWHLKNERGQLEFHDTQVIFRRELTELQTNMRLFCSMLGRLVHGNQHKDDEWAYESTSDTPPIDGEIPFPTSHPTTLQSSIPATAVGFEAVLSKEKKHLKDRRDAVARRFPEFNDNSFNKATPGNAVGLALSGGGIRSATLCQGVVHGLGQTKVLLDIDFMSTVSGGGYFGTFLSTFLENVDDEQTQSSSDSTPNQRNTPPQRGLGPSDRPFAIAGESNSLEHLRNNSRYLLAGGVTGLLKALSQLIYGAGVQFILVLLIALALSFAVRWIPGQWLVLITYGLSLVWIVLLAGMPLALHILRVTSDTDNRKYKLGNLWESATFVVGISVFFCWCVYAVAAFVNDSPVTQHSLLTLLSLFTGLPVLLMIAGVLVSRTHGAGMLLIRLAFIIAPILFFVIVVYMSVDIAQKGLDSYVLTQMNEHYLISMLVIALIVAHLYYVNINLMTLHRFYKNRLSQAYSRGIGNTLSTDSDYQARRLSQLGANPELPYHLYNATLNGHASESAGQRRRGADFFLMSKLYCGSESTGFWPTSSINTSNYLDAESCNPDLDVTTAMAISGAAVSPNMGTTPLSWTRALLAISNLRLNYWFKKPSGKKKPHFPHVGYLRHEYTGDLSLDLDYLNLSDGGHIENLGIYTLLRRKCKFIIAVDGEADLGMTRSAISKVIRLARQDMNIKINIDTSAFSLDKDGYCQSHFVLGTINYSQTETGYLLYLKSSVTGNEPDDVKDYRRRNPAFPHQATIDQFFDEEQFEAYRALGEHMAVELLKPESIGRLEQGKSSLRLRTLFERLAVRHMPPTQKQPQSQALSDSTIT